MFSPDLLLALLSVNRFSSPLDDIGSAVKLGGLATVPHGVEAGALPDQRFGHYGKSRSGCR